MGEKSEKKRQLIIERAGAVFAEKGFKAVTMKDIVDACEISRGGLYLYFSCTKEIFEAVMKADAQDDDADLTGAIRKDSSASDMLAIFIKAQKKDVFRKRGNLTVAIYEYYNEIAGTGAGGELKSRFDTEMLILEKLLNKGIEDGEFDCEDPSAWARNFLFVIEGLKMSGRLLGITEAMFDREILYMLSGLVINDAVDTYEDNGPHTVEQVETAAAQ